MNLSTLRIALAQINSTVGGVEDNVRRIKSFIEQARTAGADLEVFPELVVPGYPPEDLLLKPSLIAANQDALDDIAPLTGDLTVILGYADADDDLYNAAAILHDGHLASVYHKHYLPNYGVFDEDRYFRAGEDHDIFERNGVVFGVSVCEDIWYPNGPPAAQAQAGAHLLINISASPYHADKSASRERMLATRAADSVAIVVFCNLVGGQDELIFDGASVIIDERGEVIARAPQFKEHLLVADLDVTNVFRQRLHDPRRRKMPPPSAIVGAQSQITRVTLPTEPSGKEYHALSHFPITERLPRVEEVYQALVLGTRDYTHKNGFEKVVIGLSGGVDSSLVACIAADALGAENVTGVTMPSRYSAEISGTDAAQLADNLGIQFMIIPIEKPFQAYLDTLAEPFAGQEAGVAEENLQARTRGNLLMALSNKFGWLVLTTGNKSEMSVGYATLYGDMAGGFAVIKDVPKQLVYALARWRNEQANVPAIPERVLTRAPTAELRHDQKDTDSLPPYEVLDPILQAYVEEDRALVDIVAMGFDETLARRVIHMVDRNEYKRRQAPPGIKITPRAFGKDRRLPITNRFHPQ